MRKRIPILVSVDHMKGLRGTPLKAVSELIKNGYDAGAKRVEVSFTETTMSAISSVVISDDGTGMTVEDVEDFFRRIGLSWKGRRSSHTPDGRRLWGQKGQGRIGAFALGSEATWNSRSTGPGGAPLACVVTWDDQSEEFDLTDEANNATPSGDGTTVTITGVRNECERLRSPQQRRQLTELFASYLHEHPGVELIFDGDQLSPKDVMVDSTTLALDLAEAASSMADVSTTAQLVVTEWEYNTKATIALCRPDGWVLQSVPARVTTPGIAWSAKLLWDGSPQLSNAAGELDDGYAATLRAARRALRAHFETRADEARRALLGTWKSEGSYPYEGEPQTAADEAERDLFDLVAVSAAPSLTTSDQDARSFTLHLLKIALQKDAGTLRSVLEHVVGLDPDELDELSALLERTSLASMIAVHRTATDRIAFCGWLESVLNDSAWVAGTTERGGIQSFMEQNIWIFGDDWQTVVADQGLSRALHLMRSEDDTDADIEPVRDANGRLVRVDLLLSRARSYVGRRQNLVVELKRPSQRIRKTQLDQLETYVDTVLSSPQFDNGTIDWTFVLVGLNADEHVNRKRASDDRPHGLVDKYTQPNGATYEIWVRTWSELIGEAKERLKFLADHLPDFPNQSELDALDRLHSSVTPVTSGPDTDDS